MGAWLGRWEAIVRRRRWERPVLLALLLVLVLPGTWLRSTLPHGRIAELSLTALPLGDLAGEPQDWPAGLTIEGLWVLDSPDPFFGGYSALMVRPAGRALAFSDLGEYLAFTLPGRGPPAPAVGAIRAHPAQGKARQDIEAVTSDRTTGRFWIGYEQIHAIRRFNPREPLGEVAFPSPMQWWDGNSGAEALVRLADGRFLALGERNGVGLLFPGDPVEGAEPLQFRVDWPAGHHPVDGVELPDGRVLVLTRRVATAWPAFESLLLVADPREISADKPWQPRLFARLDGPLPRENYEAVALEPDGAGVTLWLMSDDNFGTFQRTLLAKLRWRP
jgi:hypothetical protein